MLKTKNKKQKTKKMICNNSYMGVGTKKKKNMTRENKQNK